MGGCYGGRDGVFAQELDMGFDGASREEEGDRVQVGIQEEGSSIRKKGEKSSRLA
jgi:hypothetical protein